MSTILVAVLMLIVQVPTGERYIAKYNAPYATYEECEADVEARTAEIIEMTGVEVLGHTCKPEYRPAPGQGI